MVRRKQLRVNFVVARERLGLSQSALARRAKVSQSTVAHIETGRKHPGIDILLRLTRALETSLDELLK